VRHSNLTHLTAPPNDPSCRRGLRPLAYCNCRFESHRGHGCVFCECCVLSGSGLCVGPIPLPEESYGLLCAWVWSWSLDNEQALANWGLLRHGKMLLDAIINCFWLTVIYWYKGPLHSTLYLSLKWSVLGASIFVASVFVNYRGHYLSEARAHSYTHAHQRTVATYAESPLHWIT